MLPGLGTSGKPLACLVNQSYSSSLKLQSCIHLQVLHLAKIPPKWRFEAPLWHGLCKGFSFSMPIAKQSHAKQIISKTYGIIHFCFNGWAKAEKSSFYRIVQQRQVLRTQRFLTGLLARLSSSMGPQIFGITSLFKICRRQCPNCKLTTPLGPSRWELRN